MRTFGTWKKAVVLALLAACAVLADGAKSASAQWVGVPAYESVYVPTRYKLRVNGRRVARGVALMPVASSPVYVTSSPVYVTSLPVYVPVVAETRYVTSYPVANRVIVRDPYVSQTSFVTSPVVETRYVRPFPVYERIVTYPY